MSLELGENIHNGAADTQRVFQLNVFARGLQTRLKSLMEGNYVNE